MSLSARGIRLSVALRVSEKKKRKNKHQPKTEILIRQSTWLSEKAVVI